MKTYYEFFAGGGMVHAALEQSWTCLFANDICPKKADSYKANWGQTALKVADIHQLTSKDLPGYASLAWASFPCQDLSLAGNQAGLNAERSGAFWGYWALIRQLIAEGRKPSIIVLENVCGALSSHDGKDFQTLISTLMAEGYLVGAFIVDAVHFVPQSRPRLFIVGLANEAVLPKNLISDAASPAWHSDAVIRAYNKLSSNEKLEWVWWNPSMPSIQPLMLDSIIEAEPNGVKWNTMAETTKLINMMSDINRQKVIQAQAAGRLKVGTVYKRTRNKVQRAEVRFDGIAGCLRTPSGGSSRQTIVIVDGANIRSRLLSPRETARLMGLGDSYVLPLKYNDAYHLTGDGVVVSVVKHLDATLFTPIIAAQRQIESKVAA